MTLRVGLVTPPIQKANEFPMISFVNILSQFLDIYLFCGEISGERIGKKNVHTFIQHSLNQKFKKKAFLKLLDFFIFK